MNLFVKFLIKLDINFIFKYFVIIFIIYGLIIGYPIFINLSKFIHSLLFCLFFFFFTIILYIILYANYSGLFGKLNNKILKQNIKNRYFTLLNEFSLLIIFLFIFIMFIFLIYYFNIYKIIYIQDNFILSKHNLVVSNFLDNSDKFFNLFYFNSNYSLVLQASTYFNLFIIKNYPICMKHIFKYKTKNILKSTEFKKRNYSTDKNKYKLMNDFTKAQIKNNSKSIILLNKIHDYLHKKELKLHFNNLLIRSAKLKHKLLEHNGILKINNKDLEIFEIVHDASDFIVLKNIDIINSYAVYVSIWKFNPKEYGNFLFYNVNYLDISDNLNITNSNNVIFAREVNKEILGNGNSILELNLLDLKFRNKYHYILPPLKYLLIDPYVISSEFSKQFKFKDIINPDKENGYNDCPNNFKYCQIVKNSGYNINSVKKIKPFNIFKDKYIDLDKMFLFKIYNNEFKFNNYNSLQSYNKLINCFKLNFKKDIRIEGQFQLDSEYNILNYKNINSNIKIFKLKLDVVIEKIIHVPRYFFFNHFFAYQNINQIDFFYEFIQNYIIFFNDSKNLYNAGYSRVYNIFKNIIDFYSISKFIFKIKKYNRALLNFENSKVNILLNFIFVVTKNDKNENILVLLCFNNITGYIINILFICKLNAEDKINNKDLNYKLEFFIQESIIEFKKDLNNLYRKYNHFFFYLSHIYNINLYDVTFCYNISYNILTNSMNSQNGKIFIKFNKIENNQLAKYRNIKFRIFNNNEILYNINFRISPFINKLDFVKIDPINLEYQGLFNFYNEIILDKKYNEKCNIKSNFFSDFLFILNSKNTQTVNELIYNYTELVNSRIY